ncbi:MAG: hypothetical protein WC496_10765 [Phycisphaerae bacterium]
MRIRIIAAFAIGVVLLGLLPASRISPPAAGVFAILNGAVSAQDLLIFAFLSLAAGFIASALCTPYGAQIGILAAPAGMAYWGLKSAAMSTLFQAAPAVQDRLTAYSALRFEAFVWLVMAGCCLAGALAADKLLRRKPVELPDKYDAHFKMPPALAILIAVVGTVIVGNLLINIFAGDISYPDSKLGRVAGQPANLQIAFGVTIAFMSCGFLAKLFMGASFLWSGAASAVLSFVSTVIYSQKSAMEYLVNTFPAVFFIKPVASVLPIQMVAFGCIGAVWGYWLAVRYRIWRLYES